MGLFGGSAASSQSLSNTISFNPIVNIGDGNDGSSQADLTSKATATATAKDEFGLSAGVALGDGASASGGPVGIGDDVQPTNTSQPSSMFGGGSNMMLILGGAVALVGGGVFYLTKKKKR